MYAQTEVLNQTRYLQACKASTHLLFKQLRISLYVTVLYFTQNQIILSAWYQFALGIRLFSYPTPPLLRKVSPLQ